MNRYGNVNAGLLDTSGNRLHAYELRLGRVPTVQDVSELDVDDRELFEYDLDVMMTCSADEVGLTTQEYAKWAALDREVNA